MSSKWLSIESFDNCQRLLLAVNRLLIHFKLKEKGVASPLSPEDVLAAREQVLGFLELLSRHCASHEEDAPFLGVDLRRREFFSRYLEAKSQPERFRSGLFRSDLTALMKRVTEDVGEDDQGVTDSLSDLRVLVEEHMHSDKRQLFGTW